MKAAYETPPEHLEALLDGARWAEELKPGDVFRGSFGEAVYRGLDPEAAQWFSCGGQMVLTDRQIVLNGLNVNTIHTINQH